MTDFEGMFTGILTDLKTYLDALLPTTLYKEVLIGSKNEGKMKYPFITLTIPETAYNGKVKGEWRIILRVTQVKTQKHAMPEDTWVDMEKIMDHLTDFIQAKHFNTGPYDGNVVSTQTESYPAKRGYYTATTMDMYLRILKDD